MISKSKKKRKFRAMTNSEFCNKHKHCITCPQNNSDIRSCCWFMHEYAGIEPYRTKDGKYILVELIKVKE